MTQRYKSDCHCCKFIKRGLDYFGEDCDIFVTTSSEQCVIFRYSDRPSDNRAIDIETMRYFPQNYQIYLDDEEIMSNFTLKK